MEAKRVARGRRSARCRWGDSRTPGRHRHVRLGRHLRARSTRLPVQEWGGITYALSALDAALPDDWEIVPLIKVGRRSRDRARHILCTLRRIAPDAAPIAVPYPNNRVELRYFSDERRSERLSGGVPPWNWLGLKPVLERGLDALYVNFISGFELELETAQADPTTFLRPDLLRPAHARLGRAADRISRAASAAERRRVVRVLRPAAGERGRDGADGAGPDGARGHGARDGVRTSSSRSASAASCISPRRASTSSRTSAAATDSAPRVGPVRTALVPRRSASKPAIRRDVATSGAQPISPDCSPVISCPTRSRGESRRRTQRGAPGRDRARPPSPRRAQPHVTTVINVPPSLDDQQSSRCWIRWPRSPAMKRCSSMPAIRGGHRRMGSRRC